MLATELLGKREAVTWKMALDNTVRPEHMSPEWQDVEELTVIGGSKRVWVNGVEVDPDDYSSPVQPILRKDTTSVYVRYSARPMKAPSHV